MSFCKLWIVSDVWYYMMSECRDGFFGSSRAVVDANLATVKIKIIC